MRRPAETPLAESDASRARLTSARHEAEGLGVDAYDALRAAVIGGDDLTARAATEELLGAGHDAQALIRGALTPAMDEVGRRFEAGEFFLPEVLVAARAMKAAQELIQPILAQSKTPPRGRVVLGTVAGDLHDIGKNLVAAMLGGAGFEITDLGADVSPDRFVAAVGAARPQIVGLSALLTTTMPAMQQIIEALEEQNLRADVKVMVGGAPLTGVFATEIGADGYAPTAAAAVHLARELTP